MKKIKIIFYFQIIKEKDAENHLYLKEKCEEIIKDNNILNDVIKKEVLEDEDKEGENKNKNENKIEDENEDENEDDLKFETIEEKIVNKLINYTKYKRDRKDLDKINLELGEKNLVLI